jgi:hypothetical protein
VDQVVRDVDPSARATQRLRAQHVPLVEFQAAALKRAGPGAVTVANQAPHLPSRPCQRFR